MLTVGWWVRETEEEKESVLDWRGVWTGLLTEEMNEGEGCGGGGVCVWGGGGVTKRTSLFPL